MIYRAAALMAALLALVGFGSVQASVSGVAKACNGCSELQYKLAAIEAANGASTTAVVVDNVKKRITQWTVFVSSEPGAYYTHAVLAPLDSEVEDAIQSTWQLVEFMKDISVPPERCPAVADFMFNAQCQGRAIIWVNDTGGGFFQSGINAAWSNLQDLLSAVNLGESQAITLNFSDGTEITIRIEWSVDISDGSLELATWEFSDQPPRYGDEPLPGSPEDLAGWSYSGDDQNYFDVLQDFIDRWGIPVHTDFIGGGDDEVCYVERLNCVQQPPSNGQPGQIVCTVEAIGC